MTEISALEAENKLSELLDRAARGEETTITRNGKPVARIVPVNSAIDVKRAQDAAQRIRDLAKEMKLGPFDWEEWKGYRDEGRR